ncbi:hypothetical protein V8F06_008270 [Rhypophila decipiens]
MSCKNDISMADNLLFGSGLESKECAHPGIRCVKPVGFPHHSRSGKSRCGVRGTKPPGTYGVHRTERSKAKAQLYGLILAASGIPEYQSWKAEERSLILLHACRLQSCPGIVLCKKLIPKYHITVPAKDDVRYDTVIPPPGETGTRQRHLHDVRISEPLPASQVSPPFVLRGGKYPDGPNSCVELLGSARQSSLAVGWLSCIPNSNGRLTD